MGAGPADVPRSTTRAHRCVKWDTVALSDEDTRWLGRCVELARRALEAGDEPFGSVLVSADGHVLFEDHNHVADGPPARYRDDMMALYAARFRP